jgi:translocation and assembly module TamB
VQGEVALADGAADIPMAGLELRQIQLRAASDPDRPGQMALTGGLVSGGGRLDLQGELELASNSLALNVTGDRVQIYNTADASAVASPDLQIGWSDQILKLRGQVIIPEAAITPKLGLSAGLQTDEPEALPVPGQIIAPSPDVVIIAAGGVAVEPPPTISPVRLDSQVTLILGDEVNVNALGFISRITGKVTFTNEPRSNELLPRANGRLSIEDGTYRAFGQNLDIQTGQLIFGDVPVDQPELNVRAVRWIDNDPSVTVAGISITGLANEPTLELFSRRQMEDSEIQSYLLTGRAPGNNENVLGIGTYLNPKFYVGYGYNLQQKTSEFNSLYNITPRYGVGADVGEADNNLNLTFTHEH